MPHDRAEIEATLDRYLELRRRIDAGEETGWTGIAEFFTDDCVYIDPAWGRVEGIAALREFLDESMRGLEDWTFPVEFVAIEGDQVVVKWTQITPPGPTAPGTGSRATRRCSTRATAGSPTRRTC